MNTANKLLIGSITRTMLIGINMVIAFFMMPFIIKSIGDKWYGVWTVVGSMAGYYYLVDFGLASAVQRYIAKYLSKEDFDNANITVNTALIIFTFLGMILFIVTILLVLFAEFIVQNEGDLYIIKVVIFILGANLALEFPVKAFAGIVGAYVRYDLLSYARLFVLLLTSALIVYFLSIGYGIIALAIITFIGTQISNILFFLIARYLFKEMEIKINHCKKEKMVKLFKYSVWSFLISISEQLRFRIDSIVIAIVLNPVYVTHYFIGARLADYFREIIFRATDIVTPIFTRYHAREQYSQIREKLIFLTKINSILSLFIGGIIVIVGKAFITKWMGTEYLDAYPVLFVLIIAMIFDIIQNPSKSVLYAVAKHRYFAIVNTLEGVFNLIFSLILIHYYGILGVALATIIPLLIFKIFFVLYFTCKSIEMKVSTYAINLLPTFLFTIVYLVIVYIISERFLDVPSYASIFVVSITAIPPYAFGIYFVSFNKFERNYLRNLIYKWA